MDATILSINIDSVRINHYKNFVIKKIIIKKNIFFNLCQNYINITFYTRSGSTTFGPIP